MIYCGRDITAREDRLVKVDLEYLYNAIKNPKADMESKIRQLRIMSNIDKKQYALFKRRLPYIVTATFSPPFRRIEYFSHIDYFILDIDHLSAKEIDIHSIREIVEKDDRVILSFISPSSDGLKLMFKLEEKCYDHAIYSMFYKLFSMQFSKQYGLEQVLDQKTSDVSRACFMSVDEKVHYNPHALPIKISTYLDLADSDSLFQTKRELDKIVKENLATSDIKDQETDNADPSQEIMDRIREKLNPNKRVVVEKKVYVPEILNDLIEGLTAFIQETGITVGEIINISYAKKMRFSMGNKQSEINVFYGKKGFTVVKSPKAGTSEELNNLMVDLIESYINTNYYG